MERAADQRLGWLLSQFIARGIVSQASKAGLAPLLLGALLPIAVVALTQVPVKQVLGALKALLLI